MKKYFQDKICVILGRPLRCSRLEARDMLIAAGGIPDNDITSLIDYVITFEGAEKLKKFQKAYGYEKKGLVTFINEELFFEILDGKAPLPPSKEKDSSVIVFPADNPEEIENLHKAVVMDKGIKSLAKHGVVTDNGRVKVDLSRLDTACRVAKMYKGMGE